MDNVKFVVQYQLPYTHTVKVGVFAANEEEAIAKAQAAFDEATLWDDTEDMPLICEDFNQDSDADLEFIAIPVETGEFPEPKICVKFLRARAAAYRAANLLATAYKKGKADGGSVDWDELDEAFCQALQAIEIEPPQRIGGDFCY